MRQSVRLSVVALFVTLAAGVEARGQNFFGGGGAAFDPEIDVVESGALLDASATVSADRKYVTLTARPQLSTLVALRQFTFQGGGGPVGFNNGQPGQPAVNGAPAANNAPAAAAVPRGGNGRGGAAAGRTGPLLPALARPAEPKPAVPVLHREGMVRVDQPAATPARPPPRSRRGAPAGREPADPGPVNTPAGRRRPIREKFVSPGAA
jgi:hypothetical protein